MRRRAGVVILVLVALSACTRAQPAGEKGSAQSPTSPASLTAIPVVATPPQGVTCPTGWHYFDNPELRYGLCYPKSWGFLDLGVKAEPMTGFVSSDDLLDVRLVSPDGFPWPHGASAIDVRAIVIEIHSIERGMEVTGSCTPSSKETLTDGTKASWCDWTFDLSNARPMASASGAHYGFDGRIPLRSPAGSTLGLNATTSGTRYRSDPTALRETLLSIMRTVFAY